LAALKSIADMASRTATSDVRADVRTAARYIKRAAKGRLLTLDDVADPTSSMAPTRIRPMTMAPKRATTAGLTKKDLLDAPQAPPAPRAPGRRARRAHRG